MNKTLSILLLLLLWSTSAKSQTFLYVSTGQNFTEYYQVFDEAYAFSQAALPQKNQLLGVGGGYRWPTQPNWIGFKISLEIGRGLYQSVHYKKINQKIIYQQTNDLTFYSKQSIALQLPIWQALTLDVGINANHYRYKEQVYIVMLNRDVSYAQQFWLYGAHASLNYQLSPTWHIHVKGDWMIPTSYASQAVNTHSTLETKVRFTDASFAVEYHW